MPNYDKTSTVATRIKTALFGGIRCRTSRVVVGIGKVSPVPLLVTQLQNIVEDALVLAVHGAQLSATKARTIQKFCSFDQSKCNLMVLTRGARHIVGRVVGCRLVLDLLEEFLIQPRILLVPTVAEVGFDLQRHATHSCDDDLSGQVIADAIHGTGFSSHPRPGAR